MLGAAGSAAVGCSEEEVRRALLTQEKQQRDQQD